MRRCSSAHLLSAFTLGIIVVCMRFYTVLDLLAVTPSELDARGLTLGAVPPLPAVLARQSTKLPTNFRQMPTDTRRPNPPKNDGSKSNDTGVDAELPASRELLDLPAYTRQMAKEAVRPTIWTCSSDDEEDDDLPGGVASPTREGFAFVHVYKAAGSTLRDLFSSFAFVCGDASWLAVISCTSADRCKPKFAVADREAFVPDPSTFNRTVARDYDIIGGHFRIGTFTYSDRALARRHITFLRDAKARFVSGILYQLMRDDAEMSLEDVVRMVKHRVIGSRKAGEYWSKSLNYLLTPEQSASLGAMAKGEDTSKATALMAVQNLVSHGTIVGMAENMAHSLSILRHVLSGPGLKTSKRNKKRLNVLFDEFSNQERTGSVRNRSDKGDVSTASVLELLMNDTEFTPVFDEYLKYEDLITGYASRMHELQYREVTNSLR